MASLYFSEPEFNLYIVFNYIELTGIGSCGHRSQNSSAHPHHLCELVLVLLPLRGPSERDP